MDTGFDPVAPGQHFSQWDVASKRRYNVSRQAPRPSWDVPNDWQPHPAQVNQPAAVAPATQTAPARQTPATPMPQGGGGYNWATSDPQQGYVNTAMQDAAARASGARLSAQVGAPNDPSLAAYAGLEGELGGQSQAAHDVNAYLAQLAHEQQQQEFQRQFAAYQMKLAEDYQRQAHQKDWLNELGSIGGNVLGAYFGGL